MQYAEFWILETAIDAGVPFSYIVGPGERIASQWNRPYHNLSRQAMLDLLDRLAQAGDIVASVPSDYERRFSPSRAQIDSWLEFGPIRNSKACYFLTPQGGERWEHAAKVDWNRFHSFEWDCDGENILEIGAITPEIAERAFQYSLIWNELQVLPNTIQYLTHQPWTATYWKTLPVGYGVRFEPHHLTSLYYEEDRDQLLFPGKSQAEIVAAKTLAYREYEHFSGWYTKHPDTPKISNG